MKKFTLLYVLTAVVLFFLLVAAGTKTTKAAAGAAKLHVTCSVDIVGPAINANVSVKKVSDGKAVKGAGVTINGVKFIDKYKNGWYFGTLAKVAAGTKVILAIKTELGDASASGVMPEKGKILNTAVTGGDLGSFFQLSNNYKGK
jgi:hypothetical protein